MSPFTNSNFLEIFLSLKIRVNCLSEILSPPVCSKNFSLCLTSFENPADGNSPNVSKPIIFFYLFFKISLKTPNLINDVPLKTPHSTISPLIF